MLAGKLQWAILNPYWNVPDYLAQKSIAPKILAGRSLASLRMEALSDWGPNPRKLKPSEIDWPAVAAGEQVLRLRELPGRNNSMGSSEERRAGKECVSPCGSRWSPYTETKTKDDNPRRQAK